jgi:hypothetical protein
MLIKKETKGEVGDQFIEAIFESSNILMTTYFPEKNKLYIHFNRGGTYSYTNVTENIYNAFEMADSQGKYFLTEIKKNPNKYPYAKEFSLTNSEINNAKQVIKEYNERN